MSRICKHYFITGRVQGVWFRASTQQKAKSLNITGFAKNLPDGRVEVIACGDDSQVNLLEKWLWQGPSAAEVSNVTVDDIPLEEHSDFLTK